MPLRSYAAEDIHRSGQETLPEPGPAPGHRDGTIDPLPRTPHTGDGAYVVRGWVSTRRGSEELGMIAPFWPGACATRLQHAAPFGSWLQGPGVNLNFEKKFFFARVKGHGDEAVEDVFRDE